jgi:hypothetical protein
LGHVRRVWWTSELDDRSWTGSAVATAVTVALFVFAFFSMTRLQRFTDRSAAREQTTVLQFTTPPPVPRPRPVAPRREPRVPPTNAVAPDRSSPVVRAPFPIVETDTAASSPRGSPLFDPIPNPVQASGNSTLAAPVSPSRGLGASNAPTGFLRPTDPATIAARDSLEKGVVGVAVMGPWRQLTPSEIAASRGRAAPGLSPVGRAARLPGEKIYAPLMSGQSQVAIAGASIAILGGPSKKERRRADSLNADYLARLDRLQDLIQRRRDSLRADSLRRDSIARARIRP